MGTTRPNRCDALVVTCMDFRLQQHLDPWLARVLGHGHYDRVAVAGGVKDQEFVLAQLALAHRLHEVRLVVFLNHEDCGAYGEDGTLARHQADLRAMQARVRAAFPTLQVALGYLRLDGTFVHVPADDTLPRVLADVIDELLGR